MPLLTPISAGFVLDNRYEVVQFLGYGGFGRTYLARDRQRFNELCVLKEFAPQISSPEILRKATELFQREAGTLYKLRHQQIPEFRAILQATIGSNDVLLIVEQYISGETYEQWVEAGNRLDEAGAVQFLKDIL
ncbi:MAG: serine/threonine protein kinase, partial [Alkalinema sp. CAN_BIN05]|nr:serine/threonine protein kinase [Alkalinema sp. CAN_BIN05]